MSSREPAPMAPRKRRLAALALAGTTLAGTTLGGVANAAGAPGVYDPQIDPATFSTTIDNPFFPLPVGRTWVYRTTVPDGVEHVRVQVLAKTKVVDGVTCVVVHDTLHKRGKLIEDTYDWYAQDAKGNVWYFGEDTTSYSGGRPDKGGSFQAGKHGAKPGIIMLAHPKVGRTYREEYLPGEALDQATVVHRGARAKVPLDTYTGVLVTRNFTKLEPGIVEHKWYARGVGSVRTISPKEGEVEVLVKMTG